MDRKEIHVIDNPKQVGRVLGRGRPELAAADLELMPDELREIDEAQIEALGARYSDANQRMIDR
jgi:hypothetical protein